MARITLEELRAIARASRIAIPDEELARLVPDIEGVLEYASQLSEYARQLDSVPEYPRAEDVTRPDEVVPFPSEALLERAPVVRNRSFVVPRIIKQS